MVHLQYYAAGEHYPKSKGNYFVWDEKGKVRICEWNGRIFREHRTYIEPMARFWAEIPSLESLEFNYGKEE